MLLVLLLTLVKMIGLQGLFTSTPHTSYKFRKCIVPLLVTHLENCYIVIFGDLFMKYSEVAVLLLIETMLIAQVFLEKVVFRLRPPRRSFTDRGTNSVPELMEQLCKELYINKVLTPS